MISLVVPSPAVVSIDATERNPAERAMLRYTKRLEILEEIDRSTLAARSPAAVAQAALERIAALVPFVQATVIKYDRNAGDAVVRAVHAPGATGLEVGDRIPLDNLGRLADLEAGQVSSVDDVSSLPSSPLYDSLRTAGASSWTTVPLVAQGELMGTLNVGSDDAGGLAPEDVDTLREVANSLAIAVRQSRLFDSLRQQAAELEERVAERTEELETFSYSISHDLRTPLRAITGFSRVLCDEHAHRLDAEGRRLLDVVRRRADDMDRMIHDLLAFFCLSRRGMNARPIPMTELAREVVDELRTTLPHSRFRLRVADLPDARGDHSMIRQVFVNLLSNAIKFTEPKESASIDVGHTIEGHEVVYWVRDNGVGFDPRYADKLFGVFQRLHRTEEFDGTGLGLAIAHRIVRFHGGRIWAEGRVGEGATVFFTLAA